MREVNPSAICGCLPVCCMHGKWKKGGEGWDKFLADKVRQKSQIFICTRSLYKSATNLKVYIFRGGVCKKLIFSGEGYVTS